MRRLILKALRMARTDAGLTISELAKRAGVARDTISNAERGQHSLQAPTLNKLARALGRAPSELLAEEEKLAPKVSRRSSLEPSLDDVLEDLRRTTGRFQIYHEIQKAMDEYRELWERRLSEEDLDKTAFEEADRALRAFWPAVTAAADAEMHEFKRQGIELETAKAESVLLPTIARFQALGERANRAYRENFQNVPASNVYALFPQREANPKGLRTSGEARSLRRPAAG